LEKSLGLGIGQGRGLSLVRTFGGAFDAVDRIGVDGVLIGEEIEMFGERG